MTQRSKTPLFLMEVIIMLLIFAISAAVCLQVFAHAKQLSETSGNIDRASLAAQEAAECWQGEKCDMTKTADVLKAEVDKNRLVLFFDEYWEPVKEKGRFQLVLTAWGSRAAISVRDYEEEIFTLETEAVMYGG